jgi:hypothetical protein
MLNQFYKLINKFANDNILEIYNPTRRLYHQVHSYIILMLPVEDVRDLIFGPDLTYKIGEHHMTVFENMEQHGNASTFHYTAKLNSSDGFYQYRLRVFFNDNDQPIGVSWYRKSAEEPDDLFVSVDLPPHKTKLTMDFSEEYIKPLINFIRTQQTTQVNKAQEDYHALYHAYELLNDAQIEDSPFPLEQALGYLGDIKKCLYLQDELGMHSSRSKLRYITRLEALIKNVNQPKIVEETLEIPDAPCSDASNIFNGKPLITPPLVTTPKMQTQQLEEAFSNISEKHTHVPDPFKSIPTSNKRSFNEQYLEFINELKNDYRKCCEHYLLVIEGELSMKDLTHFKSIMDKITTQQEIIESKFLQTLLLFGDETTTNIESLKAHHSAIKSLQINNIKLLIRHNKSKFLEIVLTHKKISNLEILEIMKYILVNHEAYECLRVVLNHYRIHSLLLQRDNENVLLVSYLFRLPITHPMRLECVYDIPAISSSLFHQKLQVELQKNQHEGLYDTAVIAGDIENASIAQNLYACSSEQKIQMRESIEWMRQLPVSIKNVLNRKLSESTQECEKKVRLIHEISNEINTTLALLSESSPEFVRQLKQESMSMKKQFQTAIYENEESFVECLNYIDAQQLDLVLDNMIEYSHLINNYLRYCLPSSLNFLSETANKALREYYYNELKRFGMKNNSYMALEKALSSSIDELIKIKSIFLAHQKQLHFIHAHPHEATSENLSALLDSFDQLSNLVGSWKQTQPKDTQVQELLRKR